MLVAIEPGFSGVGGAAAFQEGERLFTKSAAGSEIIVSVTLFR